MQLDKEKQLASRMKELREARGWSQPTMAAKMGVAFERYKKWEQRGKLPLSYAELFCDLTQADLGYFITGRGRRAVA